MNARRPLRLAALALLTLLGACGKNGDPQVPGSSFPHMYPNPNLAPSPPAPDQAHDQPAMQGAAQKAQFTKTGSYIDPAVRDTELSRGAVTPGSALPYAHTQLNDGSTTPFNESFTQQSGSPLPPITPSTPDPQTP